MLNLIEGEKNLVFWLLYGWWHNTEMYVLEADAIYSIFFSFSSSLCLFFLVKWQMNSKNSLYSIWFPNPIQTSDTANRAASAATNNQTQSRVSIVYVCWQLAFVHSISFSIYAVLIHIRCLYLSLPFPRTRSMRTFLTCAFILVRRVKYTNIPMCYVLHTNFLLFP